MTGPGGWRTHPKGSGGGPRGTDLLARAGRFSPEELHFLMKSPISIESADITDRFTTVESSIETYAASPVGY